jgi:hypothetical protein
MGGLFMPDLVRAVLAAAVVAGAQVWGAGPVAADSGAATVRFTCTVAPFPGQSVTARLAWTAPDSVIVGQPTPPLSIEVTTILSDTVTEGAGVVEVASVEGRVDASAVVAAPEGVIDVDVPLTVPRTAVPESGQMTIRATGTIPGRVFHQPGPATVTIGSAFDVSVDLKDAAGDPAQVDHLDVSCVLDPGQNTVLSTFEITTAERTAPGGPTGSAASPGAGTHSTSTQDPSASGPVPVDSPGASPEVREVARPAADSSLGEVATRALSPASALLGAGGTTGWLLAGAILVVVAGASGCSWWLVRRRRG